MLMSADGMPMDADELTPETGVRPQHLIVTVFGRYVRAHGGEIRIAALIEICLLYTSDAADE